MESRKASPANSELNDWRARCLTAAGFALREAYELASDDGVDLHALLELIDRGCPHGSGRAHHCSRGRKSGLLSLDECD